MSSTPTPPPRSPERPGGPPLRRSNEGGDDKKPHHFPWKVEPSPDGRGAPPPPKPPMLPRFTRRIWPFLLILFALNYWIASTIPDKTSRVDVPYTVFKNAVRSSNVVAITSKGTAIQGVTRRPLTYPPGKKARTSKNFQTEQPAFADTGLESLLEQHHVTVNAKPLDSGRSALASILLGFGPTILFVVLLVFLMRRAAGGGLGGSGGIEGSAAHGPSATRPTDSGSPSRTSPASTTPRRSSRRSSTSSRTPIATASSVAASRAACCWPVYPAPARPCWRVPSQVRRACRSSRSRRPSSSR